MRRASPLSIPALLVVAPIMHVEPIQLGGERDHARFHHRRRERSDGPENRRYREKERPQIGRQDETRRAVVAIPLRKGMRDGIIGNDELRRRSREVSM